MRARITVRKVAGKKGHWTTAFGRFGLLDCARKPKGPALRADIPR
jgi:hypothetical protein